MPDSSARDQAARFEAFQTRAAPLEQRARTRYDGARAKLAAGDAPAAIPLLEEAVADLRAVEALQRELLPELEGDSPELRLVEDVLGTVRGRVARGDVGPWMAPGAPLPGPDGDGRGRAGGTFEA